MVIIIDARRTVPDEHCDPKEGTPVRPEPWLGEEGLDPLHLYVKQALSAGWVLVPQVGIGFCENALLRPNANVTDLVTIPVLGHSTAVRFEGGPEPGFPRQTGREWWRHHVPPEVALRWLLTDPDDDERLVRKSGE
jgi:hypothetical protein